MAEKRNSTEILEALEARYVAVIEQQAADLRELRHDVAALAIELGNQLGEPFRSRAAEIMATRQTTP